MITSPTGAVIDDMLHRIEDRFPCHVQVYPVLVQGVGSKEQVTEALNYFTHLPVSEKPDVIILARGGGSLEDLWTFNEECVVRAIFACDAPVVSAIGHEPDVTLCDYVADLRAPTPTAAAEMIVPVQKDLLYTVSLHQSKLNRAIETSINALKKHISLLKRALPSPTATVNQMKMRLDDKHERMHLVMQHIIARKRQQVDFQKKLLHSYSPNAPLERGYVYMTDQSGEVLRSKQQGNVGDDVLLHFSDGQRKATLKE